MLPVWVPGYHGIRCVEALSSSHSTHDQARTTHHSLRRPFSALTSLHTDWPCIEFAECYSSSSCHGSSPCHGSSLCNLSAAPWPPHSSSLLILVACESIHQRDQPVTKTSLRVFSLMEVSTRY